MPADIDVELAKMPVGGNTNAPGEPDNTSAPTVDLPKLAPDTFENALEDIPIKLPPKSDETKPVEAKIEEPIESEVKTIELPKVEEPATPPAKPGRDYTGLSDDEVKLFKQMGNESYSKLYPVYLEHKKLKDQAAEFTKKEQEWQSKLAEKTDGLPTAYYQHPEAYVLNKKYQTAVNALSTIGQIESHLQTQLAKIEDGEDWTPLSWDGSKLVEGTPLAANARAKAQIITALQNAQIQKLKQEESIKTIVDSHKQGHEKLKHFVASEIEDKFFPAYTDANLAKPEGAKTKEVIDKVVAALPEELQGPLAKTFGKAYAAIVFLSEQLAEAKKAQSAQSLKAENKQIEQVKPGSTSAPPPKKDLKQLWQQEIESE